MLRRPFSQASRGGRWVSWHLSPTSPVNVPSTCALDSNPVHPAGRSRSGYSYNVRTTRGVSLLTRPVLPLRNRVDPLGEIVSTRERGLVYGNRGCLHDAAGRIVRRSATKRWIACRLAYRGWYRTPVPAPGRYTGLFFVDDATALAAGHRPCALCRRADYDVVRERLGLGGADAIDRRLHAERMGMRRSAPADTLPNGAFVLHEAAPHLVWEGRLRRWSFAGYGPPTRAHGALPVVTPASLVEVLRRGWHPLVPFVGPDAPEDGPPGPGDGI